MQTISKKIIQPTIFLAQENCLSLQKNNSMEFRTPIKGFDSKFKIGNRDKLFFIGSCFTENIGLKLQNLKFETLVNPFGIIYNPISILQSLEKTFNKHQYIEKDLFENHNIWHSFDFHSRFSDPNKENCLKKMNSSIATASEFLSKTNVLFVTFGSAHTYNLLNENKIVSNCHKLPASRFGKKIFDFDSTVKNFETLFSQFNYANSDLKIVLTVSPIRYLSDGFVENQKSKALLILLCHALAEKFPFVDYYPAYEIMMDDLRDYRFYNADMIHPNNQAIDYIFSHFSKTFFCDESQRMMTDISEINKALEHKTFFNDSENYKKHCGKMIEKIERVKLKYPFVNFSDEIDYFKETLE